MDGLESRPRRDQPPRIGDCPWEDLREEIAVRFPRAGDDPPEASAVQAGPRKLLPRRVHGDKPAGLQRIDPLRGSLVVLPLRGRCNAVDIGMDELQYGAVHPRFTRHRKGLTDPEHRFPVLHSAEPDALERARAVGKDKEEPGFCPETENTEGPHFPDNRKLAADSFAAGIPPSRR